MGYLPPWAEKDGSEPLTFHHDTFSRFKFVLISKEKRPAIANVPVKELPAIFQKIRNLSLRDMLSVQKQKSEPSKSPAYTTTINAGTLKGKTPAALLLEDAQTNKRLLINQKNWLESNLGRYPRNAAQITAIEDALRLYEAGQLDAEESKAGFQAETVYSSGMRPLIRRKRGDKYFVYEISIRWDGVSEKPVEIDIRNYYAPVTRTEKGLLNVKAKEREGEIRNVISLTLEEWLWVEHIPYKASHTGRRTYATALKDYGVPISEISADLGHSSILTTQAIYYKRRNSREKALSQKNAAFVATLGNTPSLE